MAVQINNLLKVHGPEKLLGALEPHRGKLTSTLAVIKAIERAVDERSQPVDRKQEFLNRVAGGAGKANR